MGLQLYVYLGLVLEDFSIIVNFIECKFMGFGDVVDVNDIEVGFVELLYFGWEVFELFEGQWQDFCSKVVIVCEIEFMVFIVIQQVEWCEYFQWVVGYGCGFFK